MFQPFSLHVLVNVFVILMSWYYEIEIVSLKKRWVITFTLIDICHQVLILAFDEWLPICFVKLYLVYLYYVDKGYNI